jgi:hypothetical protein
MEWNAQSPSLWPKCHNQLNRGWRCNLIWRGYTRINRWDPWDSVWTVSLLLHSIVHSHTELHWMRNSVDSHNILPYYKTRMISLVILYFDLLVNCLVVASKLLRHLLIYCHLVLSPKPGHHIWHFTKLYHHHQHWSKPSYYSLLSSSWPHSTHLTHIDQSHSIIYSDDN